MGEQIVFILLTATQYCNSTLPWKQFYVYVYNEWSDEQVII